MNDDKVLAGDELKPFTHINAFYANVEDKKKAVDFAVAKYNEAIEELQSHPDYVEPEKEEVEDKPVKRPIRTRVAKKAVSKKK